MLQPSRRAVPAWVGGILAFAVVLHLACAVVIGGGFVSPPPGPGNGVIASIIVLEVVAFALAWWDFRTYWVGLLGVMLAKLAGVATTISALASGAGDASAWFTLAFDGTWLVLLAGLVGWYLRPVEKAETSLPTLSIEEAARTAKDQNGTSLTDLSMKSPALVVCVRHFGCTFCREALADLARMRPGIEADGTRIVLVHMGTEDEAAYMLNRYGLEGLSRISDPLRRVYRALELRRGSWGSLLGGSVWLRGFRAVVLEGHGVGVPKGDLRQMPGVFLMSKGEVLRAYRHKTSADRPNYAELAGCERCPS